MPFRMRPQEVHLRRRGYLARLRVKMGHVRQHLQPMISIATASNRRIVSTQKQYVAREANLMDRRNIAVTAAFAVMALAGARPAQASQCTIACDQSYTRCDSAGGKNCLPQWGQCKKACTAAAPAKTTPVVATKPATKPKP